MRKDPVPNLSPLRLTVLPKMAKNDSSVFYNFTLLGFLTSKMTSKFKFYLIRPT